MNIPHARRLKTIDDRLRVHAWTPDGFLFAGVLELEETGDREMSAAFRYEPAYLVHRGAFPLDPVNMPMSGATYATNAPHVVLGSLFDSAPDAFGRRVVKASLPASKQGQVYREAFLRGADGIGALILTGDHDMDLDAIVQWSLRERPSLSQVEDAARAARELDSGIELDDESRALLAGSWTIGGARPKAILRDDRPGAALNSSVIAKFESRNAQQDGRNRMEWAALEMASEMGMRVPARQLLDWGDHTALVLERFDRVPGSPGGAGRRHYVSAASFVSTKPQSRFMDSAYDQAMFSWRRLLDVTSAVSVSPQKARIEMYSRLCLNAAIGNTDDHLKNYGFLKVDDRPTAYEIAPVFDVSPQPTDAHYLHCGSLGRHYTLAEATQQAREMKISQAAANQVRDQILSVLERRLEYFDRVGMSRRQVEMADAWIRRGSPELGPAVAEMPTDLVKTAGAIRAGRGQ